MAAAQQLSAAGRKRVAEFIQQTGKALGVNASEQFTIEPSLLQTLQPLIQLDGSPFLQRINVMPVPELKGQKLFMGQSGLLARRTNTGLHDREAANYSNLSNRDYDLHSVEANVGLPYQLVDSWAKFPNFSALWNDTVRKAIANDRVRVGWHGTHAATETDPDTYPNGEDVAPGWLAQIRAYNSGSQYVAGTTVSGNTTTHHVVLGGTEAAAATASRTWYPNLDYLVNLAKAKIDPVFITDPDLVVFISQDLVSYEEAQFYKVAGRLPQQKQILESDPNRLLQNYGGLPAYSIPFMPNGTILVSCFKCLSIYYQDTSWRRLIRDWAPRNRYEDFSSRNEGYVCEDFRECSLVDGITTL